MNLVPFPMYVKVAHFIFRLLMSCVFCMLSFVSFLCDRIIMSLYLLSCAICLIMWLSLCLS
jgi:hypothetical protein